MGEGERAPTESSRPWSRLPKYRWRFWWALTGKQRRAVLRLARRRQVHPDPVIREAAVDFALRTRFRLDVFDALLGGDAGNLAEVRAARRIRRAERVQPDAYPL